MKWVILLATGIGLACSSSSTAPKQPPVSYVVTVNAQSNACSVDGGLRPFGGASGPGGSFSLVASPVGASQTDTLLLPASGPSSYYGSATINFLGTPNTASQTWTANVPGSITFVC